MIKGLLLLYSPNKFIFLNPVWFMKKTEKVFKSSLLSEETPLQWKILCFFSLFTVRILIQSKDGSRGVILIENLDRVWRGIASARYLLCNHLPVPLSFPLCLHGLLENEALRTCWLFYYSWNLSNTIGTFKAFYWFCSTD